MKYRNRFSVFTLMGSAAFLLGLFLCFFAFEFLSSSLEGTTSFPNYLMIAIAITVSLSAIGLVAKCKRARIVLSVALHLFALHIIILLVIYGGTDKSTAFAVTMIFLGPAALLLLMLHNQNIIKALEKEYSRQVKPGRAVTTIISAPVVIAGIATVWLGVFSGVGPCAAFQGADDEMMEIIVAYTNIPAGRVMTMQNLARKKIKQTDVEKHHISPSMTRILLGRKTLEELNRGDPVVLSKTELWTRDEDKTPSYVHDLPPKTEAVPETHGNEIGPSNE